MEDNRKVGLVTGGARGIGLAIATKMAEEGCRVAILDMPAAPDVAETLKPLQDRTSVLYVRGDITKADSREACWRQVLDRFGRVDFLVNNAGVAPRTRADLLEMTEESFDFIVGVNLKGTFFMTRTAAAGMAEAVGHLPDYHPKIVNISSISAYTSSVNRGEYCISKAGVSMITRLFADRLAEWGIYVYEIRPGIIRTDMTAKVKEKYDRLIEEGLTPIRRWGMPEDVARAVWACCSGALDFSTGEIINVDGGFHLRRL